MKIDCVSDLHGHYPKLEGGDLLIVAGDFTANHTEKEFTDFIKWLGQQRYEEKIIVAGNHDTMLTNQNRHGRLFGDGICYLQDWGIEFEGLKIWGSPWTKRFKGMNPNCMAFTVDTEEELAEKLALIPRDTDILITHSPPHGCYLDQDRIGTMLGSVALRDALFPFTDFRPKLHVFGHIHESYGSSVHHNGINLINASHVNERYEPVNKPIRVEL